MKVVFRADASIHIGTGHVMRCLTLAEELRRQGGECEFICRAHEGHLGSLITQKGFKLHLLAMQDAQESSTRKRTKLVHSDWLGVTWQKDAEEVRSILNQLQTNWLVVDHYALDARWEASVCPSNTRLLVLDDLADREHLADILLDQNLGRKAESYMALVPKHCICLIGPEFALLRPEFAQWREVSLARRRQQSLHNRLLINLGGVDRDNVTGQVLEVLKVCNLPDDCEINVIMGATAPWLNQVKLQARELPWPTEVSVGVSDMARRMAEADLAIGAAGSTSWERCCLGLPTLMFVLAENQREVAMTLDQLGAAKLVAEPIDLVNELPTLINEMEGAELTKMSFIAASIVSGEGNIKLIATMQGVSGKQSLWLEE